MSAPTRDGLTARRRTPCWPRRPLVQERLTRTGEAPGALDLFRDGPVIEDDARAQCATTPPDPRRGDRRPRDRGGVDIVEDLLRARLAWMNSVSSRASRSPAAGGDQRPPRVAATVRVDRDPGRGRVADPPASPARRTLTPPPLPGSLAVEPRRLPPRQVRPTCESKSRTQSVIVWSAAIASRRL